MAFTQYFYIYRANNYVWISRKRGPDTGPLTWTKSFVRNCANVCERRFRRHFGMGAIFLPRKKWTACRITIALFEE